MAEPARRERRLRGIPVSPGIAIGPVFTAEEKEAPIVRRRIQAADTAAETTRLDAAVTQSRTQLLKLRARLAILPEDSQAEIAPLLDAYVQMLAGSRLLRGARQRIAEALVSAETALGDTCEEIVIALTALPGDAAGRRRRADEVREITRRVVRNLTRTPFRSFADLPGGAVLIAEGLRPADAALLEPAKLAGVLTEEGGTDGHTAILLRALGVPAVLGVPGLLAAVRGATAVTLDGGSGDVVVNPGTAARGAARRGIMAYARERQRLVQLRHLPAVTRDGTPIELAANLELPAELPLIARSGATGIGLLRTEFLFMNREALPDEDDQAETYRTIVEAMGGDPVTIRVLDWGGEKEIEALTNAGLVPEARDANPALGLRGIRLLLRQPELLDTQLAAILRAAVAGPVRILLPMVNALTELREAREHLERTARRLRRAGTRIPEELPPLGIMVETPGAALAADALAQEADFFAIGTNDLAMYTLAVDRGEAAVATLYDPLHPAVLRLIQFATEAALRFHVPVSVCGEMAADPRLTPLLVGLGLRQFSMSASAVPRVKQAVRALDLEEASRLAHTVMGHSDSERIRALILGA
ncbi:MAG: phosphoenolpyruvate--protein phosphotransferase [Rhodospirillales bacterium]|nr:phosphoenolpyruvate--protein phosphotransferase [Rhodospirillales bacterium]